ncbi:MAG: CBS domain-containing protein [Candidatus Rokubacteria bacterium]|nr:CBS domain-containing protein [Candidatus Rokubacteria bacterium]
MRVNDIMTCTPFTIDPDAPLGTALAAMRQHQVRHLPVLDDKRRLVGMITDRDLRGVIIAPALEEHLSRSARRRLRGLGATIDSLRVRDVMTWNVVTIEPDATLGRAAALMFEERIGSLPVVANGELVGIVTERDALKALVTAIPAVRTIDPGLLW